MPDSLLQTAAADDVTLGCAVQPCRKHRCGTVNATSKRASEMPHPLASYRAAPHTQGWNYFTVAVCSKQPSDIRVLPVQEIVLVAHNYRPEVYSGLLEYRREPRHGTGRGVYPAGLGGNGRLPRSWRGTIDPEQPIHCPELRQLRGNLPLPLKPYEQKARPVPRRGSR